jgi:hypothetical protein
MEDGMTDIAWLAIAVIFASLAIISTVFSCAADIINEVREMRREMEAQMLAMWKPPEWEPDYVPKKHDQDDGPGGWLSDTPRGRFTPGLKSKGT